MSYTGCAVTWSAVRTWSGVSAGFAWSRTAAAPAACGDAMLVPDAVPLPFWEGQMISVPPGVHVDEIDCPGAVMSGW